ncbi:hypothetical protein N9L54_05910 [Porticoccaceae bacterium]|nr:hypothetical protein [Porticoccaceae bacterium]
MGFFNKARGILAAARLNEEAIYEQVYKEIEDGDIRQGLWLKVLSESDGDELKAKVRYAKARVKSIKDEANLALALGEELSENLEVGVKNDLSSGEGKDEDQAEHNKSELRSKILNREANIQDIRSFLRLFGYRQETFNGGWLIIEPLGDRVELSCDDDLYEYVLGMISRQ